MERREIGAQGSRGLGQRQINCRLHERRGAAVLPQLQQHPHAPLLRAPGQRRENGRAGQGGFKGGRAAELPAACSTAASSLRRKAACLHPSILMSAHPACPPRLPTPPAHPACPSCLPILPAHAPIQSAYPSCRPNPGGPSRLPAHPPLPPAPSLRACPAAPQRRTPAEQSARRRRQRAPQRHPA